MTTEEKRSRMTAMCRLNSKKPYNDCDRCKLRESCRRTGHPPAYMKDETVELVFNNAVQCGIFRDELTVDEMREKLVRLCDTISSEDCLYGACPISESCVAYTEHLPENASDDEIKAIFADLIRRGDFKEE
ncbi:MAG: hypothetical protein IJ598_04855 [Ruminococcus sp.]|nr:hypothetical protein [Ruminococcus sp.]